MTSPLSNQQLNPKVTPLDDDQVELTLTLPDDLVQDFLKVLDSLTNLATIVRSKTRLARLKDNSADIAQLERIKERDAFYARVVNLYDCQIARGLKRTAAIKAISIELRKEKHPWASIELVRSALVAAGRPGQRRNS